MPSPCHASEQPRARRHAGVSIRRRVAAPGHRRRRRGPDDRSPLLRRDRLTPSLLNPRLRTPATPMALSRVRACDMPDSRTHPACRRAEGQASPEQPVPRRLAGSAAPAPTPSHCEAGNRVKRRFRGEFRPRVLVDAIRRGRFVPRAGCRREVAATRHVSAGRERKPISGVQRRRRPDRQVSVARRSADLIDRNALNKHVGNWELGV